ncbi:MAG: regulatory protein GemA [Paludibacteraceae bacterium]|nr:regulatory protein GemA [Paludibacteraceae bacterium]
MMTAIQRQEKNQRRVFHALAYRLGMSEEQRRQMLIDNYGVESSADLDAHQLTDLIHTLDKAVNPSVNEADIWRKRIIAVVCEYLKLMGQDTSIQYIKAVACRAAEYDDFNSIPTDRLRSVYNAFKNRVNAIKTVSLMNFHASGYAGNQMPSC